MVYLVWSASFLGNEVAMGDGTDALNASLSADIVSSYSFFIRTFYNWKYQYRKMKI